MKSVKIARCFSYLLTSNLLRQMLNFQLVCIFQRSGFQTGFTRVRPFLYWTASVNDDSPLRLTLLSEDMNSSLDDRVHSAKKQAMDGSEMGIKSIKRSHAWAYTIRKEDFDSKKTNFTLSIGAFAIISIVFASFNFGAVC